MAITLTAADPATVPVGQLTEVTLTGTELTKTTTVLYVDDQSMPFEWISAEEVTISLNAEAAGEFEVTVEKGGVTAGPITITASEDAPAEEVEREAAPEDAFQPTATGSLAPGAYQTQQDKVTASGKPARPLDEEGEPA